MTEINRQWLLAKRPVGMVSEANFEYRESPVPKPAEGEVLVRNLYLSFDPAMRGWMEDRESYLPPIAIGAPMRAGLYRTDRRVQARRLKARRPRARHVRVARLCRHLSDERIPTFSCPGRHFSNTATGSYGDHGLHRVLRTARPR